MPIGLSNQLQSILPVATRKKLGYSYLDQLRGQHGLATRSVISEKAQDLDDKIREDEVAFRDAQFKAEQDAAKQAAAEASTNTAISTVGLGLAGKDIIKAGAKKGAGLVKGMLGGGSSTASETVLADSVATLGAESGTAATGASTAGTAGSVSGLGAESGAAGTTGGSSTGAGAGLGTTLGVLAAIAAQKGMSNSITNKYKGQQYRDALYFNEEGAYEGAFGSEPWREYAGNQFGYYDDDTVSAGRAFDTAWYNEDYGEAAKQLPATISGWANPGGEVLYDASDNFFGLKPGSLESSIARSAIDPISAISNLFRGTHFCTAINNTVPMTRDQNKTMVVFREYCEKHAPALTKHYNDKGHHLVHKIHSKIIDRRHFWNKIKTEVMIPVINAVKDKEYQTAVNMYVDCYLDLIKEYHPSMFPKNEIKEDTNGYTTVLR